MTIALASRGPQAYVYTNGREWVIRDEVAEYFRRQPCTFAVHTEWPLKLWGQPGPRMRAMGLTGNIRPDVVAWCDHRKPVSEGYMTVVEVKAGTAGVSAVTQLHLYLEYLRELPLYGFRLRGILAAPSLSNAVHSLPPGMEFWRIRGEWRR